MYAEFSPSPDLSWIGTSLEPYLGRGMLGQWLTNHGETVVASRIAAALGECSFMYRERLAPDQVIAEAARSHVLVLAQGLGTRVVYWRGDSLDGPWEQAALWDAFWALALKAKRMQGLDHADFGTRKDCTPLVEQHALVCRINRLKAKLPAADLRKLIHHRDGTHILELHPAQIYLAEIFFDDVCEIGTDTNYRELREFLQNAGI